MNILGDILDAVAASERDKAEPREPKFYVSSFGTCLRRHVLMRAQVPGRPETPGELRNLRYRTILHNAVINDWQKAGILIVGDTGTRWTMSHQKTRASTALPDGFGCRVDAVVHACRDCDKHSKAINLAWGQVYNARIEGREDTVAVRRALGVLRHHRLLAVEVKTAHPNLINYTNRLPRPHNVLQARAGAWALSRLMGVELIPYLVYVPVGSAANVLEFDCSQPTDYADVLQEITRLQKAWDEYVSDGHLPDVKPLQLTTKRGQECLTTDWECQAAYCPYAPYEDGTYGYDGFHCEPLEP